MVWRRPISLATAARSDRMAEIRDADEGSAASSPALVVALERCARSPPINASTAVTRATRDGFRRSGTEFHRGDRQIDDDGGVAVVEINRCTHTTPGCRARQTRK